MKVHFLIFFLFLSIISFSQRTYREGYVVNYFGDTLRGTIQTPKNPSAPEPITRIRFKDSNGKRKKFTTRTAKYFSIKDYKSFEAINENFSSTKRSNFGEVLVDGKIRLIAVDGNDEFGPTTQYRIRRQHEENTTSIIGINFRKKILRYISDCEEVKNKVESKEWRFRDLITIITTYNQCVTN